MENSYLTGNVLLNKAILFAVERHAGQLRKGTTLPYIIHPLETMTILSSMNADSNLLIAGILHDTLEDTTATDSELIEIFGSDIYSLVKAHTEDKSQSWEVRKLHTIKELQNSSLRVKMLVMADKVANLRSMYSDYRQVGEQLWERFNAPKEKQAWYYGQIRDALYEMQDYSDTADIYHEMIFLNMKLFERITNSKTAFACPLYHS